MSERGTREREKHNDGSIVPFSFLSPFSLPCSHTLLLTFSFPRKPFSSPSLPLPLSPHVSHRWSVSLIYRYAFSFLSSSGIMRQMHLDSLLVVLELGDCSPYKVRGGVLSLQLSHLFCEVERLEQMHNTTLFLSIFFYLSVSFHLFFPLRNRQAAEKCKFILHFKFLLLLP